MSERAGESSSGQRFDALWADLERLGRSSSGGYRRFAWTSTEAALREWFTGEAQERGLEVISDSAGNLWAWWGDPDADGPGLVVGSHLDSVPDGGAFDGPLGVVSALAALDVLRARGWRPQRPLGVAVFSDEEGARFGVACAGSRIITGALGADRARSLRDADGTTMAEAMSAAGHDPSQVGPDERALRRVATFVELHVEQGKGLVDAREGEGAPVGVASSIWPHGRWRLDMRGRADHAGTTRLADRDDPMLALAAVVGTARDAAERHAALATVGKLAVEPNGVNAIPSAVTAWLDARGPVEQDVRSVVAAVGVAAGSEPVEESWTAATDFDAALRDRLAALLGGDGAPAPVLPTGAGHDAGILSAAGVPTAMLFVRNPTGVSHSPHEHADPDDCHRGVEALVRVLEELG
jgi:beta-ureidopropionase / N-carbamoyl-L-amino-acid hydrolase